MRSIAIGAIVLGNLVGAGVAGCIFGDGGGGGGTATLCEVVCDCFGAQIPNCLDECAADFPNPTAECVMCAVDNRNDCAMVDDLCDAPCTGAPPSTTLQEACQIVCACAGNPVDCQAQCEAVPQPQACLDCIGNEQCDFGANCTAECP